MGALLQRISAALSGSRTGRKDVAESGLSREMVGDFHADYSALTETELAEVDKDSEALLACSRMVSSKSL